MCRDWSEVEALLEAAGDLNLTASILARLLSGAGLLPWAHFPLHADRRMEAALVE